MYLTFSHKGKGMSGDMEAIRARYKEGILWQGKYLRFGIIVAVSLRIRRIKSKNGNREEGTGSKR